MENKIFTKHFIVHNTERLLQEFHKMQCGEKPFADLKAADFEIPFTDVEPIEGYEVAVNKDTGHQFPKCCIFHQNVFNNVNVWYQKFPDCCAWHRKLLLTPWFNKEAYKIVPLKVVQQISYTEHHIIKQINIPEWYKDITDYIDYNISSFGQLPEGYGNPVGLTHYLGNLKHWIKNSNTKLPRDKRHRLIEYIESYEKVPANRKETDFNILFSTYQKWLKIFPFGMDRFKQLKDYFSKKLPFIKGQPEYNKYTGTHSAKIQTQMGLVESLTNLTKNLLTKVDTVELVEKNLITDKNQYALQLLNAEHRLKQETLLNKFSKGEIKYIKVLKSWLNNEKEYFKEVAEIAFKKSSPAPAQNPKKLSEAFESISKYQYIMNLLVERQYCHPHTFIWKDDGKGNKELLAAIIKQLHSLGYYKENCRPTNEQIRIIAKNTFGWEVAIDTIKKAKPGHFDLTFIPIASTIE